jgi:hypothetical protein
MIVEFKDRLCRKQGLNGIFTGSSMTADDSCENHAKVILESLPHRAIIKLSFDPTQAPATGYRVTLEPYQAITTYCWYYPAGRARITARADWKSFVKSPNDLTSVIALKQATSKVNQRPSYERPDD